jgi:Ca2+-binding RTX toxin-like protein
MLFGGAGTRIARDLDSFVGAADAHARDADTIVGDNGNIVRIVGINHIDVGGVTKYVTFGYDNYSTTAKIVVRGVTLLDYTPGGPDFRPDLFGLTAHAGFSDVLTVVPGRNIWTVDIGGSDELHGESGDDTAYGAVGHDVIYGDAQDDDLIGGWGNDWISGGTGQDGILGDDGRILTSRNTACPAPRRARSARSSRSRCTARMACARSTPTRARARATCSTSSSTRPARSRPHSSTSPAC